MPTPVIVATARSPIGRAFKGRLSSARPDDLLVQMIDSVLDSVPQLDRGTVEDVMVAPAVPWENTDTISRESPRSSPACRRCRERQ